MSDDYKSYLSYATIHSGDDFAPKLAELMADGAVPLAQILATADGIAFIARNSEAELLAHCAQITATFLAKVVGPDRASDLIRDALYGVPPDADRYP